MHPSSSIRGPAGWHVGTCGWQYGHWRGPFYPDRLPTRQMLAFYATHLACVECDGPFYRLPNEATVERWRQTTPEGFRFAWKASRFLTHLKRLRDPAEPLERIAQAVAPLGDRLGPVVFQLPPRFPRDAARLDALLALACPRWKVAVEFRDPDWDHPDVYAALRHHGAALVVWELGGRRSPIVATAGWTYARLHGPGAPYAGRYGPDGLAAWHDRLQALDVVERWVFFDNDERGYAAEDACALAAAVRPPGAPPPS